MQGKQYGGEGQADYESAKDDCYLEQHGGEGSDLSTKNDTKLEGSGSDGGDGRNLKVQSS